MTTTDVQLSLFEDIDLEPEPVVRFVSLGRPDWFVPRAEVILPAGRDAGSHSANRFHFHVLDHGPQMSSLLPCQYGRSGDCQGGKHRDCSHNPGEWQHNPMPQAEGYLMHREAGSLPTDRNGGWSNLVDQSTGQRVALLPMHGWRCSCECHDKPASKAVKPRSRRKTPTEEMRS